MKEEEIQVFIRGTISYFEEVTGIKAELDIPYTKGTEQIILDYSGHIGISGSRKGGLYITCTRGMLEEITRKILLTEEVDDQSVFDMIGEIANTIAGNARTSFGAEFNISVPTIFKGKPDNFRIILRTPVVVLPINWKGYQAFLVVGID
ncbi:MAG: chemotaxis protein CheX [Spirochaetes bacterium]|nr:chemotaxis protein CheX [Spirochaetota bacterium]